MASLSQLFAWRNALETARYTGTRIVEWDGRKVEYRSDAEMRQALADLNRQITAEQGPGPITVVRITSSKGLTK